MTREERAQALRDLGTAIYGRQWQVRMAAALDVTRLTISRWDAGEGNPPTQDALAQVAREAIARGEVDALLDRIEIIRRYAGPSK